MLLRHLPRTATANDFACKCISLALEKAPNDDLRAQIIRLFNSLDYDDSVIRDTMKTIIAPYRRLEEPLTYAQIRFLEIRIALRIGAPVDLETAFAGIDSPMLNFTRNFTLLRHYVQAGDTRGLGLFLDTADTGGLSDPYVLRFALPAYELLGRKEEAVQAKKLLLRALHQSVMLAWASHDGDLAAQASTYAEVLDDSEGMPAAWIEDVATKMPDRANRARVLTTTALLHRDWSRLLSEANEALKEAPTYYHNYWLKGLALVRLNRSAEALEPLRIYLKYSHDELEFPRAKALLEKVEAEKLSPPS